MSPQPERNESQAAFVAALLDPAAPPPEGLAPTGGAAPVKRFNVYRNNVVHSLCAALGQGFPALKRLLGAPRFQALAVAFVRAHPPRSPLMFAYGEALPAFLLHDFEPTRGLPVLADLARLELSRRESYHAADAKPLDAEAFGAALSGRAADAIVAARLTLHPSLRLVVSRWPILRIWSSLQADDAAAEAMFAGLAALTPGDAAAHGALTLRPALALSTREVSRGVAAFLTVLGDGRSIGDAAAAAAIRDQDFDLAQALGGAIAAGAIIDVAL